MVFVTTILNSISGFTILILTGENSYGSLEWLEVIPTRSMILLRMGSIMNDEVDFLAHREGDTVAVAVRDVSLGERNLAYLSSGKRTRIEVSENIPLGHKVALTAMAADTTVKEYGEVVGITKRDIVPGQLVHIHNIRSGKWQIQA